MITQIDCPVCGKRIGVRHNSVVEHEEPVHVQATPKKTIGVYIRCTGSGARVQVHP